jgi:hypothetical protein
MVVGAEKFLNITSARQFIDVSVSGAFPYSLSCTVMQEYYFLHVVIV